MRLLCSAALLLCLSLWGSGVSAQAARGTVQASVTIVDPVRVGLDRSATTATPAPGGWQLSTPLSVAGAGSPSVSVAAAGGAQSCRTVTPAGGGGAWLRCFVARGAAVAGKVTEIPVTLILSSAT